jgi:hypothetical protein
MILAATRLANAVRMPPKEIKGATRTPSVYRRRKGRREMGGRGRDAAHMARARAKRAPFTDARDGRIKSQIRFAFFLSRGQPLTTSQLLKSCYCTVPIFGEKFQSWHRTNVCRAADQVAVRGLAPGSRAPGY